MYNNPYFNSYNSNIGQQNINERIDNQIAQLNQMKEQIKNNQQPAINQTFQLAPTNNHTMRYVNTIDDVNKEMVYFDTPFFSKDMSILWIKNTKGGIKTYELNEIVAKDEKDLQIEMLQEQINELRKEMKENEQSDTNVIPTENVTNTTRIDEEDGTTTKDEKSTSIQRISTSKKGK